MRDAVLPQHRPTLPDLLARLSPTQRRGATALGLIALAALAYSALRPADDGIDVVVREPIAFNLRHRPAMAQVPPRGTELLRLEQRDGANAVSALSVSQLAVPAHRGEAGGILPLMADVEIRALERRFPGFELVAEGKTRLNEVPGYTIAFRASRKPRVYGRVVLLPEPAAGARRGARIELLATPAGGVSGAADVGARGQAKMPYRSFRFGTEKP